MSNRTIKTCSIEGCGKPVNSRGWCGTHYSRWHTHGDPLKTLREHNPTRSCLIEGCTGKHYALGYCSKHWSQKRRQEKTKESPSRIYSPEDSFKDNTSQQGDCLIWTASGNQKGYGQIYVYGRLQVAHRYAWERVNGPIPKDRYIDHTCWNKSCVNVAHLRLATISQNSAYRKSAQANSRSGVRNVYPKNNGWGVSIQKNRKTHYYGVFDTIEEAALVAEQARQELFGEFAGRG